MVSRRSFVKAAAAAVLFPTINLRPNVPDERLLMAFCGGPRYPHYDIAKPFGVGSLTYATDGYAMVRCELANRQEDEPRRLPPALGVWKKHWKPFSLWTTADEDFLRPQFYDPDATCPECGDRRVSCGDTFPDLSAPQAWEKLQSLEYDMDEDTIRDESCPVCRGRTANQPNVVELWGERYDAFGLKRLLALPNLKVANSIMRGCLLFQADGFEGITLGMIPVTRNTVR